MRITSRAKHIHEGARVTQEDANRKGAVIDEVLE